MYLLNSFFAVFEGKAFEHLLGCVRQPLHVSLANQTSRLLEHLSSKHLFEEKKRNLLTHWFYSDEKRRSRFESETTIPTCQRATINIVSSKQETLFSPNAAFLRRASPRFARPYGAAVSCRR